MSRKNETTRVKTRIHEGDRVMVISGKDRGKESRVTRVLPKKGKVIVEGVNTAKRHEKPRGQTMQGGDHRPRHADRPVERHGRLRRLRADANRHPGRRQGPQAARVPQVWR
jgi:hypothetical protein